jgi:YbgC/YbaW family acyl-CoA thioester hydrolase
MPRFDPKILRIRTPRAFAVDRDVRFQDVDAAGIIFYPRVLEYFHDAYVEFLAHHGHPLPDVLREGRWAAPLRHAEADYFRPMRFGDRIEVALTRALVEATQITIGYRIENTITNELTTIGQTEHVFVDLASFERRDVPEDLAVALRALEAEAD